MYETHATVVGTVITNPVKRQTTNGEEVLSFRMASNTRRKDAVTGEWTDGATLYLTVSCWRRLLTGVGASIMKGDPVMVAGGVAHQRVHDQRGCASFRSRATGDCGRRGPCSLHLEDRASE